MVQRIRSLQVKEYETSLEYFAKAIYRKRFLCDRDFRSLFGSSLPSIAMLWSLFGDEHSRRLRFNQSHYLWALMWLKQYNTETVLAATVGCTEKTFRERVRQVLSEINLLYNDVVSLI